jgi:hypothetical protein
MHEAISHRDSRQAKSLRQCATTSTHAVCHWITLHSTPEARAQCFTSTTPLMQHKTITSIGGRRLWTDTPLAAAWFRRRRGACAHVTSQVHAGACQMQARQCASLNAWYKPCSPNTQRPLQLKVAASAAAPCSRPWAYTQSVLCTTVPSRHRMRESGAESARLPRAEQERPTWPMRRPTCPSA